MFGRRRRAASNPPQTRPSTAPSASASLAATKAFIRSQESNGALSSAAAAAALRSHTTTPTPVGETVTKRMIRRGSLSSNGSSAMPQRGGLERRGSSGSMTERSFRTGSAAEPAPPVPSVPENLRGGSAMHRRSSSHEPAYRVASPGPRGGGRGVSLDRGATSSAGRGQRPQSHLAQVNEDEHDDASPSVNFSRPMSPGAKPSPPTSHGWFAAPVVDKGAVKRMASTSSQRRPNTSAGVSAYPLHNAQQSVQNAASRPVKTHQIARSVDGTRLAGGSMRANLSGTAVQSRSFLPSSTSQAPRIVDPKSPNAVYDPDTRRFIHKQDAMARHRELHEEPEQHTQQYVARHIDSLQTHPVPQPRSQPQIQLSQRALSPVRQPVLQPQATVPSSQSYVTQPIVRQHEDSVNVDATHAVPARASYEPESTSTNTFRDNTVGQGHAHTRSANERHLSPPRSAHFAPNAVELGSEMHQPLPRSSSPAKPSLKPSSVSGRGVSPAASSARFLSSRAVSEASDTMSDDGFKKKKKTVRVSFDETPVVKSYTEPETPLTPPSFVLPSQDEFGDYMKPRPALPSFGSVRDRESRREQEDAPEKVTETVSTPMSASVGSIGEPLATSGDFALGNIVAQDHAAKQTDTSLGHRSLAPGLTSIEGSGYASDSSNYSQATDLSAGNRKHGGSLESSQYLGAVVPETLTKPSVKESLKSVSTADQIPERVVDVPAIALSPATPSPRDHPEPKYQSMTAPESQNVDEAKQQVKQTGPASLAFKDLSAEKGQQTGIYSSQADTTDDESSVYSDAYEDLEDAEGGFGSIDAVANSPVIASSSGLFLSKHADRSAAESPSKLRQGTAADDDDDDSDITTTQDWDAAKQHWSGLNQTRQQPPLEEPVLGDQNHAAAVASRALQASMEKQSIPAQQRIITDAIPRDYTSSQISPPPSKPLKSALKKTVAPQPVLSTQPQSQMRNTMRGAAPRQGPSAESHMRKTMRAGAPANAISQGEHHMRRSMRNTDSTYTPVGLAASRHSVIPLETKEPRGALQKRNIPATARPQSMPATAYKRAPAPALTYDSDSDASASSFQRERAQKRGARNRGGQYTMRSSMRGSGPAPTMRTTTLAPVRSISPPGSPTPAFRKSMRSSSPAKEPSRSSKFSIRSLSPMGRFRNNKADDVRPSSPTAPRKGFAKQTKTKPPAAMQSKASRFADSSDEDEDRPRRFQSRFADSDSDEPLDYKLPPGLAPVRGIPRKQGTEDGDSTDLEEEAEEKTPAPAQRKTVENAITNGHANGQTNGSANGQGTALFAGSLRDSKHAPTLPTNGADGTMKTKRSFFGLGGRKKTSDSIASVSPLPSAEPDIPMPPQQRNRDNGLPLAPIDEDKDIDSSLLEFSAQSQKKAPKLQRRSTPEWPLQQLPPVPPIPDDARPMSADGIAPRRPRFQNRRLSSQMSNTTANTAPIVDASGRSVSYGRTGKKKKFQGLRRVFGLTD